MGQFHKMVKPTQTICQQIADELFECVWTFCGIGALRVKFKCFFHAFKFLKLEKQVLFAKKY